MSFKIIIQLGLAAIFLILSTGAAWYEGSAILENHWEWEHTAIFSQITNGQVGSQHDILSIDHFLYAAKFAPAFPLLMLFSATHLIILVGYILLKRRDRAFSYYLSGVGAVFLILSGFVSKSPTTGLKIFFVTFLLIGIVALAIALYRFLNNKTGLTST